MEQSLIAKYDYRLCMSLVTQLAVSGLSNTSTSVSPIFGACRHGSYALACSSVALGAPKGELL